MQLWRERFARELRRLGVSAEATPRQARGKVPRADPSPVYQVEKRGAKSTARKRQHGDALHTAKALKLPQPRDWQRDIQVRQEGIRKAYLEHAAELTQGDAADRCLARDIKRFVADMPVPLTRRQAVAVELRQVLEQRSSPAATLPEQPSPSLTDLHRANPQGLQQAPERQGPEPGRRR